jgi:hypothetical protein
VLVRLQVAAPAGKTLAPALQLRLGQTGRIQDGDSGLRLALTVRRALPTPAS